MSQLPLNNFLSTFFFKWKRGNVVADIDNTPPACPACRAAGSHQESLNSSKIAKASKTVPGFAVSLLVAFFPKCPICWAAYMSMFGSFGIAKLPYQGWMYPVLLAFLAIHIYAIYRKINTKGYGPLLISLLGAALLIVSRLFNLSSDLILYTGMLCILGGSLWNSFNLPTTTFKLTPIK